MNQQPIAGTAPYPAPYIEAGQNPMFHPPQGPPIGFQPGNVGGSGPGYPPALSTMQQGGYAPPGYNPMPNQSMQPTVFGGGISGDGYAPLVTNQPQPINVAGGGGEGGWMNIPHGIPHCPPGLEYLTTIDQLLVKQKIEILEAFTGFETNNKYTVKNSIGQNVYWAVEENDCCTRNCCGPSRPFEMKIMDTFRNTVIHLNRPLACSSCFFPCCLQSLEVSSPPGSIVGTVQQEWSLVYPTFAVKNAAGDTVLRIEGPLCTSFMCCGDIEFKITTVDGTQVGKISKQWSGLAREFFTDADFFGISFPMDLDVKMKAVMLGACFLIDYMYFEKSNDN